MLIEIDIHAVDPPDPDLTYTHYLETCRRAGVTPVSRENADKQIAEWTATIAASLSVPPTTHSRRDPNAGRSEGSLTLGIIAPALIYTAPPLIPVNMQRPRPCVPDNVGPTQS
jgi:hypothetical protein